MGKDQSKRISTLIRTLERRDKNHSSVETQLRFSQAIQTTISKPTDQNEPGPPIEYDSPFIPLNFPLLYDNSTYHFHWIFRAEKNITIASVNHRLRALQDSFAFKPGRPIQPSPMLVGTVNTGNDIGWLRLPLSYIKDGKQTTLSLSIEVFSTKLDLRLDLPCMYQCIDAEFPLWRFRIARHTEQEISRGRNRGDFPIMWLAQFQTLRNKLLGGLKVIANAPHSRLKTHERHVRADRLKGRIKHKIGEKVTLQLAEGRHDTRYARSNMHLSLDTPENRFIKMVVAKTADSLGKLHTKLKHESNAPENQRLSQTFVDELQDWQKPLRSLLSRSFLSEVGPHRGLKHESLVLQQQIGYCSVYRVWQELRFYLDLFDKQSQISMRSIDEIYEIWCFLELRRILTEDLDFEELNQNTEALRNRGLEVELKDGMAGSFEFTRNDGLKITLAHEPVFQSKSQDGSSLPIRTYWLTQKPDILLRATYADGRKCIWLFDAKYRVDQERWRAQSDVLQEGVPISSGTDLVPEDALNQMHRYRDALIHEDKETNKGFNSKSRPVFGAFALYPGFFDQQNEDNPYKDVIREVGIGAFSLLPSAVGMHGRHWLSRYLQSQLGLFNTEKYPILASADNLYVQEPSRIPYHGMSQSLYTDLVLVAGLGHERSANYLQGFCDGTAPWYHCPVSTFDTRYTEHVTRELEYLAIASLGDGHQDLKSSIIYIWQIESVSRVKRSEISEIQAGAIFTKDNKDQLYWLFKLGKPSRLAKPLPGFPRTDFIQSLRISTLARLSYATHYSDIDDIYSDAVARIN